MDHFRQASGEASNMDKRAFWRGHISDWRESGLSQAAFCRKHGLKVCQFTYWKKRIAANGEPITAPVTLVRLPISSQASQSDDNAAVSKSSALELLVAGRFSVMVQDGFDQNALKRLILTLESL